MNEKWKNKLVEYGKKEMGEWFHINGKELTEFYETLFHYFTAGANLETWNKGLLITGVPGCGKSIAINLFNCIFRNIDTKDCRDIISEAINIGNAEANHSTDAAPTYIINKWGNKSRKTTYGREMVCLDNLGHETVPVVFYGTKYNIISDILVKRYELFKSRGYKTIIITNLDVKGIEDIYGDFIRDRLREMCNQVHNKGKSLRK